METNIKLGIRSTLPNVLFLQYLLFFGGSPNLLLVAQNHTIPLHKRFLLKSLFIALPSVNGDIGRHYVYCSKRPVNTAL